MSSRPTTWRPISAIGSSGASSSTSPCSGWGRSSSARRDSGSSSSRSGLPPERPSTTTSTSAGGRPSSSRLLGLGRRRLLLEDPVEEGHPLGRRQGLHLVPARRRKRELLHGEGDRELDLRLGLVGRRQGLRCLLSPFGRQLLTRADG